DRWYTQGAKITYLQADNNLPKSCQRLFDHLPALGFANRAERFGYQLGQSMFTPSDTHRPEPLLNDRPYAGWLYTGLIVQRRGLGTGEFLTLENFQVDLGVIGPDALADNVQSWYHHHLPPGWKNQLHDEPGIALKYGRAWL